MMVPGRGSGAEICWVTVVVAAQIHKKRGQTGLRILRAIVMLLLSELRCPWRATAIWRCRPIEKSTQLWRLRSNVGSNASVYPTSNRLSNRLEGRQLGSMRLLRSLYIFMTPRRAHSVVSKLAAPAQLHARPCRICTDHPARSSGSAEKSIRWMFASEPDSSAHH